MSDYMPFIVFGLITGSIYGLTAMGLVLTYKTSGVFNFGHGAVCAAAAYAFYDLRERQGLPWLWAVLIVAVVFGPLAGLILERLAVVLAPVSTAYRIVGTVGLLVAIRALIGLRYGERRPVVRHVPVPGQGVHGLLRRDHRRARDHVQSRPGRCGGAVPVLPVLPAGHRDARRRRRPAAAVDDRDRAGRVRRAAWMIGSSFAAVSGILFASNQAQLDINVLTLLVVQAFGAATIARFQSLPMAFVGGLAVGVLQKVVGKLAGSHEQLQGLDLTVPFLVLFIGLLVIPRAQLVEVGRLVRARPPAASVLDPRVRAAILVAFLGLLLALPHMVSARLPGYNVALTQVLLFVSLHLLVRTSGQISLCHFGFAAVGAAGFGHMLGHGVPFFLALLIGGLACLPLALIVAVPAIRLSGLYLALATLGFGIVLTQFAYAKSYMFGNGQLLTRRPSGFAGDKEYYYLLLGFAIAAVLAVLAVERARLGRLLRAMSDSPTALTTPGHLGRRCPASSCSASPGSSPASAAGSTPRCSAAVNQDAFNYVQSLLALAVLAIAGSRTITAAFVAPFLLYVIPLYFTDEDFNRYLQLGFGLGAIAAAAGSQGAFGNLFAGQAQKHAGRARGPAGRRMAFPLPAAVGSRSGGGA